MPRKLSREQEKAMFAKQDQGGSSYHSRDKYEDKKEFKTTTISKKEWDEKKEHGYTSVSSGNYGIPKGTKLILGYDKQTGGTVLIPVTVKDVKKDKWSKANNDFGSYAIYRNPDYPDINIHFARVKAHESYGYKYSVWKSDYPCAKFLGGSNTLKGAEEIAKKDGG